MNIWLFQDGKPGHRSQSAGLVQALKSELSAECGVVELDCASGRSRFEWIKRLKTLPRPDLLIGAGHATHLPLLFAKWRRGGRIVLLMKPTLPWFLFDLCLVPEHDYPPHHSNVIRTVGVLNAIEPHLPKDPREGLMLIGGPCRHILWSDEEVIQQVETISMEMSSIHWTMTTSRRTPDSFLPALRRKEFTNLQVIPCDQTGPGWVAERLKDAGQVWVTGDSVSMMYEALTSGAAVGELTLDWVPGSKLKRAGEALISAKRITSFAAREIGMPIPLSHKPLHEAGRCAKSIIEHWKLTG